jgi:glycosyltransferase involved in cell wall biosynthesis
LVSDVLVMIPAYDEEKNIGEVVRRVIDAYPNFEVLVINDGSNDETEARAKIAGASVISLPFHSRGTAAVLTGYLVALKYGYSYLVKIDGDGQHRPEDLKAVLQPVMAGEADICVGSRYLSNGNKANGDSLIKESGRLFSASVLNCVVNDVKITDGTSGLRAWNRGALRILAKTYFNERRLPDDSILWLVETITACRKGLKIKEVSIEVLPRMHGKSKSFSWSKMIKYPLKLIRLLIEEAS